MAAARQREMEAQNVRLQLNKAAPWLAAQTPAAGTPSFGTDTPAFGAGGSSVASGRSSRAPSAHLSGMTTPEKSAGSGSAGSGLWSPMDHLYPLEEEEDDLLEGIGAPRGMSLAGAWAELDPAPKQSPEPDDELTPAIPANSAPVVGPVQYWSRTHGEWRPGQLIKVDEAGWHVDKQMRGCVVVLSAAEVLTTTEAGDRVCGLLDVLEDMG